MKKGLKILSIVGSALWMMFLVISLIAMFMYKDPEADAIDFALSKAVYNVFILVAAIGLFNSTLTSLCLYSVFNANTSEKSILKKVTLCALAMTNLLFYASICLIFVVNNDVVIIAPIMWALCAAGCLVLLVLLRRKKEQKLTDH